MLWQDHTISLGERCVYFSENEMKNGIKEDKPGSYSSPRIREYFSICTRLVNGVETNVNFTKGNWCAASASYALYSSLLPSETRPHGYRLGVVEIVSDLQKNNLYKSIAEVNKGNYYPKVGDVIIFDRSNPSNPQSNWWRHIGRVYSNDNNGNFECISGNSGGCWRISKHNLKQKNLLGFGEYPVLGMSIVESNDIVPDWSDIDIMDLVPLHDSGTDLSVDDFYDIFEKEFKG